MYAYGNNGLYFRAIDSEQNLLDGEMAFSEIATDAQLAEAFSEYAAAKNKSDKLKAIADLETTITDRRIREAVLGIDNGWLANVNAQIAALRSQL